MDVWSHVEIYIYKLTRESVCKCSTSHNEDSSHKEDHRKRLTLYRHVTRRDERHALRRMLEAPVGEELLIRAPKV